MFRHVLIATNGGPLSLIALRDGVEIARICHSFVTFATCSAPYQGAAEDPNRVAYESRVELEALPRLDPGIDLAEKAEVAYDREHILSNQPGQAMLELAERRGCDLVVMASRGHRPLAGLLLGSQTLKVLTQSQRPVLVCVAREGPLAIRHLLVPTDGSEPSGQATLAAIDLAVAAGARVTLLTCTAPAAEGAGADVLARHEEASSITARQRLGLGERYARDHGVPVATEHVHSGNPHQAILECAGRCGCDLILMASHGRKGTLAVVLGSETLKVLTQAKLPVLVWR